MGLTESEADRCDGSYYHGAYGPTIILVADSVKAVKGLRDVFVGLSEEGGPIDLAAAPAITIKAVSPPGSGPSVASAISCA